jgi:hypothetical protein
MLETAVPKRRLDRGSNPGSQFEAPSLGNAGPSKTGHVEPHSHTPHQGKHFSDSPFRDGGRFHKASQEYRAVTHPEPQTAPPTVPGAARANSSKTKRLVICLIN